MGMFNTLKLVTLLSVLVLAGCAGSPESQMRAQAEALRFQANYCFQNGLYLGDNPICKLDRSDYRFNAMQLLYNDVCLVEEGTEKPNYCNDRKVMIAFEPEFVARKASERREALLVLRELQGKQQERYGSGKTGNKHSRNGSPQTQQPQSRVPDTVVVDDVKQDIWLTQPLAAGKKLALFQTEIMYFKPTGEIVQSPRTKEVIAQELGGYCPESLLLIAKKVDNAAVQAERAKWAKEIMNASKQQGVVFNQQSPVFLTKEMVGYKVLQDSNLVIGLVYTDEGKAKCGVATQQPAS